MSNSKGIFYDEGYRDALEEVVNTLDNILTNPTLEMLNGKQALSIFKLGLKEDIENVR